MIEQNSTEFDFLVAVTHLEQFADREDISFCCHENSYLVYSVLRDKGHSVQMLTGRYEHPDGRSIFHSWVEHRTSGTIFETDVRQVAGATDDFNGGIVRSSELRSRYKMLFDCRESTVSGHIDWLNRAKTTRRYHPDDCERYRNVLTRVPLDELYARFRAEVASTYWNVPSEPDSE